MKKIQQFNSRSKADLEPAKKLIRFEKDPYGAINSLKKKAFYGEFKQKFSDKIIDYPDSPTGKAYVGIAKQPLMPVKNGYGYMGVILQDDDRKYVQCYECGKWAERIGGFHLKTTHGLSVSEYKKKYGLFQREGLCSDQLSMIYTKACLKNKHRIAKGNTHYKTRKKGTYGNQTIAFQNRHATCPEQLKQRLFEFIRCNRELPSRNNRGFHLYQTLVTRFGTFQAGLQHYNLPYYFRLGSSYEYHFPDGTKVILNQNKLEDRETLYNLISQKVISI
jgi:hypothetical protein